MLVTGGAGYIGSVLVPGARAPKLVTEEMVSRMAPGSIIVVSCLAAVALLVGGAFFFRRLETTFADVI